MIFRRMFILFIALSSMLFPVFIGNKHEQIQTKQIINENDQLIVFSKDANNEFHGSQKLYYDKEGEKLNSEYIYEHGEPVIFKSWNKDGSLRDEIRIRSR